jgi:hypothetical protein
MSEIRNTGARGARGLVHEREIYPDEIDPSWADRGDAAEGE